MSLADEYAQVKRPQKACATRDFYNELSPEDREFFDTHVNGNLAHMYRTCTRKGLKTSFAAFRLYVRGEYESR